MFENTMLSRRTFVAAAAAAGVSMPVIAMAAETETKGDFELAGLWVLALVNSTDEDANMMLQLGAMFSTTTMELSDDGKVAITTSVIPGMGDDSEPEVNEGTWESTDKNEVVVSTADGDVVYKLDGVTLVNEVEADGVTITVAFAKAEDILSGAWYMSILDEKVDSKREGIAGAWTFAGMQGSAEDPIVDAAQCAMAAISMSGAYMMKIDEDGTALMLTMGENPDPDAEPEITELTWSETDEKDVYTFAADGMEIQGCLVESGALFLAMGADAYMMFAPIKSE